MILSQESVQLKMIPFWVEILFHISVNSVYVFSLLGSETSDEIQVDLIHMFKV